MIHCIKVLFLCQSSGGDLDLKTKTGLIVLSAQSGLLFALFCYSPKASRLIQRPRAGFGI